jgi:hypothetical protein
MTHLWQFLQYANIQLQRIKTAAQPRNRTDSYIHIQTQQHDFMNKKNLGRRHGLHGV